MSLPSYQRISEQIDALLSPEAEDYEKYTSTEIFALSIASLSHRRLIRTHNFNSLTREFSRRLHQTPAPSQHKIDQLQLQYQEELDTRAFNFRDSEVQIQMSDETTAELLKRSQAARLLHPKVQDQLWKTARSFANRAQNECQNTPVSVEDFYQELMLYLMTNGERNFNPLKAAYTTYAIATLHYRAQHLYSLLRGRNICERLSDFSNHEDDGRLDEKLQGSSINSSANATEVFTSALSPNDVSSWVVSSAMRKYDVALALNTLLTKFTPLERSALFLKNHLSCKSSFFPFPLSSVIRDAERRGADALYF